MGPDPCQAADAGWLSFLESNIVGVIVGFILAWLPEWRARNRARRGHWGALAAEAEIIERLCGAYVHDRVPAPLYRLPEAAFVASFPALLAEGVITRLEARQLTEFWAAVQEVNRGLDRAGDAQAASPGTTSTQLQIEAQRLEVKCRNILEGRGTTLPDIGFIRDLLEKHAGKIV